ncbi:MAG: sigma-70 family RNA polymerase sigma factor [Bacteroidia bacterium]|nr:sigma-70 family RNA polymerase sigma factor [Bacteroidia bacterium]
MHNAYLVECIRKGGSDRDKALEYCYKSYFKYQASMKEKFSKSLTPEDIEEAYDDALVAFDKQMRIGQYQGKAKLTTYFFAIFRNKCLDLVNKNKKKSLPSLVIYPKCQT